MYNMPRFSGNSRDRRKARRRFRRAHKTKLYCYPAASALRPDTRFALSVRFGGVEDAPKRASARVTLIGAQPPKAPAAS